MEGVVVEVVVVVNDRVAMSLDHGVHVLMDVSTPSIIQHNTDPAVIACDADLAPLLHAALAHAQASTAGTTALPSLRAVVTLYGDEPTSSSSSSSSHQPAPVKCLSHEAWLRHRSSGSGMVGQRCDDEDAVQCLVYTSGAYVGLGLVDWA